MTASPGPFLPLWYNSRSSTLDSTFSRITHIKRAGNEQYGTSGNGPGSPRVPATQNPVNRAPITPTECDTDEGPPRKRRHAAVSRAQSVNHKAVTQMGCAFPRPSTNMATVWPFETDNAKQTAEIVQRRCRSLPHLQNFSQVGSNPGAQIEP